MCEKYLCGPRIMCGLMWAFFVSGLMKLKPENLYLNIQPPESCVSSFYLVTCASLKFSGSCEQWASATFPCPIPSHVQYLESVWLFLRFMALNVGFFSMSCHLYPSHLPVKGWPWLFLLLFFAWTEKQSEKRRESSFPSSLFYFRPRVRE